MKLEHLTAHWMWPGMSRAISDIKVDLKGLKILTPDLRQRLQDLLHACGLNLTAHRVMVSTYSTSIACGLHVSLKFFIFIPLSEGRGRAWMKMEILLGLTCNDSIKAWRLFNLSRGTLSRRKWLRDALEKNNRFTRARSRTIAPHVILKCPAW